MTIPSACSTTLPGRKKKGATERSGAHLPVLVSWRRLNGALRQSSPNRGSEGPLTGSKISRFGGLVPRPARSPGCSLSVLRAPSARGRTRPGYRSRLVALVCGRGRVGSWLLDSVWPGHPSRIEPQMTVMPAANTQSNTEHNGGYHAGISARRLSRWCAKSHAP
jgi:hypothetical protein